MKRISNKEYEKYQQYKTNKLHGRILTPDGLRVVCASLDNDPEKTGKHMLEMFSQNGYAGARYKALPHRSYRDVYTDINRQRRKPLKQPK